MHAPPERGLTLHLYLTRDSDPRLSNGPCIITKNLYVLPSSNRSRDMAGSSKTSKGIGITKENKYYRKERADRLQKYVINLSLDLLTIAHSFPWLILQLVEQV